jgi:pSer/pThr/pTyr-binding forkhead associated (FHA) protein
MFSKIFGRKDNTQERSGAQEAAPETSTPVLSTGPEQGIQNLTAQDFGLMFTIENGRSQTFITLPISIGRGEQNAFVIQDPSVSIQHAYVYYDERLQKVCISDLDSTNGLFINDRPTRRNILQDDARIQIGSVMLTFRDTGYIHSGT